MFQKIKIELLDCQVDLVLKSLEMLSYMYGFIYPRSSKSKTNEENLRISMANDTYNQILNQLKNSEISAKNERVEKIFKKI